MYEPPLRLENTTASTVADWLMEYARAHPGAYHAADTGQPFRVNVDRYSDEGSEQELLLVRAELKTFSHWPPGTTNIVTELGEPLRVGDFKLLPLGERRVEFQVSCPYWAYGEFFRGVVEAVKLRWEFRVIEGDEAESEEEAGTPETEQLAQDAAEHPEADARTDQPAADAEAPGVRDGGEEQGQRRRPKAEKEGRAAEAGVADDRDTGAHRIGVFRRSGEIWEIRYATERPFHLSDRRGLQDIAYLLRRPDVLVPSLDLVLMANKTTSGISASEAAAVFDQQDVETEDRAYHVGDKRDVEAIDMPAGEVYRLRLREQMRERQEAEERGDEDRLAEIDQETADIEDHLRREMGLLGRRRFLGVGRQEKARQAVRKRIRDAVDEIRPHDSELAKHLDERIDTGLECRYISDKLVDWVL